MRIGEVCGLKKKDLVRNSDGTFLYVQRAISQWRKEKSTKTGSWMFKPVPKSLFIELEMVCRERFPGDFIWTTRYGNPYNPGHLSIVWHRASVLSGLNISLYAACRHSRATREMIELQREMWRKVGRVLGDTAKIARGYVRPIEERRVRKAAGGKDK
jgi:integrase